MNMTASLTFAALVSLIPVHLYAQQSTDKKSQAAMMSEPSKEQRAKMADMHAQAAECLRSDKSFDECREQMMENCPMAQDGSCPMMGMHKMHQKKSKAKK